MSYRQVHAAIVDLCEPSASQTSLTKICTLVLGPKCAYRTAQFVFGGLLCLKGLCAHFVGIIAAGHIVDHACARSAAERIADGHGATDNRDNNVWRGVGCFGGAVVHRVVKVGVAWVAWNWSWSSHDDPHCRMWTEQRCSVEGSDALRLHIICPARICRTTLSSSIETMRYRYSALVWGRFTRDQIRLRISRLTYSIASASETKPTEPYIYKYTFCYRSCI